MDQIQKQRYKKKEDGRKWTDQQGAEDFVPTPACSFQGGKTKVRPKGKNGGEEPVAHVQGKV